MNFNTVDSVSSTKNENSNYNFQAIKDEWYRTVDLVLIQSADNGDYYSAEDSERLKELGERLVLIFDKIFSYIFESCNDYMVNLLSVYREYIAFDNTTLIDLASKYGRSKETVRKKVNRSINRLNSCFKKAITQEGVVFSEYVNELIAIIKAVDYNLVPLFSIGLSETGRKKKNTILNMLFGKRFLNEISANCKKFTVRLEKQKKLQKHNDKLILEWEKYRSKIIFPCSSYNKSDSEKCYNPNLKYGYEKKFLEKMQRFSDYVDVIINPDIVYYSSKETDHRPMFLLRLNDGTKVLVVLLQTINMALIYNIRRCNELHRFCKENGYGYLIIDDRGNSIYDVKNRVIDDELVSLLNIIIARRGIILWSDIKDLKLTRPVSNLDIAAYVLQNKLYFTMEPYRIMQR